MANRNPTSRDASIDDTDAIDPDEEPVDVARDYLEDAPGDTQMERVTNAQTQAQHDYQNARQQIQELQGLARKSKLASEVLGGAKDQVIGDAADAVLGGGDVQEVEDDELLDENDVDEDQMEDDEIWEDDDSVGEDEAEDGKESSTNDEGPGDNTSRSAALKRS